MNCENELFIYYLFIYNVLLEIYIFFDQYVGLKFHLVKKYEIVYQLEGMTQQIKLTVFVIFIIRDQLNHINL